MPSRSQLSGVLLSIVVGVVIAYMLNFGSFRLQVLVPGALIGFFIGVIIEMASAIAEPTIRSMPEKRRAPLRAALFFGGGVTGFFVGYIVYVMVLTGRFPNFSARNNLLLQAVAITGPAALLVGVLATSFEQMKEKLRDSVSQLKEAEFAQKELELARAIQRRLLPAEELSGVGYSTSARNVAARYVAGDFYDVFEVGEDHVSVVVADVAGKGMAASLIMATVKARLPLIATGRDAEETLRELNRRLVLELSPREFVAMVFCRMDLRRGLFDLCNAGMPDPYLMHDGGVTPLQVPGPRLPLGVRGEVAYETLRGELRVGEQILFVSDGLPESQITPGEPLGYDEFAALASFESESPGEYLDSLFSKVRERTALAIDDDWTALILRREPASLRNAVSA